MCEFILELFTTIFLPEDINAMLYCLFFTVEVPRNISAPDFIGPIHTDMGYHFICRIVYTLSLEVDFEVTLTFDGKLLHGVAVKNVSSTSSLDVIFTPHDFAGHYGKTVSIPQSVR